MECRFAARPVELSHLLLETRDGFFQHHSSGVFSMKRAMSMIFVGVCAAFGGGVAVNVAPLLQIPSATANDRDTPRSNSLAKPSESFEDVARRVSPSVVYIEATKPGGGGSPSTGRGRSLEESGSGVIVRAPDGRGHLVLTNNHVIAQAKPEQITISLADGRLVKPHKVWTDPESDVAVIRLDSVDNLSAVPLGDSDKIRVGQWVLAFGSPFGLNQSVTHGIISARERGQVSLGNTIRIKDFLQTDAAINPGSSGGPLVNLEGEIIGINTAIASQSGNNTGVAFSIPINLVKRVMDQLLEKGAVSRGYLGMQLAMAFEPADALRLGLERVQGALVETVYPETPAAAAGLRAGDVVLQVDGLAIRNENHLINLISSLSEGKRIRMDVWRERRLQTMEAAVGDWARAQGRLRPGS
jgi:S1-C subfamily serine protease